LVSSKLRFEHVVGKAGRERKGTKRRVGQFFFGEEVKEKKSRTNI